MGIWEKIYILTNKFSNWLGPVTAQFWVRLFHRTWFMLLACSLFGTSFSNNDTFVWLVLQIAALGGNQEIWKHEINKLLPRSFMSVIWIGMTFANDSVLEIPAWYLKWSKELKWYLCHHWALSLALQELKYFSAGKKSSLHFVEWVIGIGATLKIYWLCVWW